MGWNEIIFGGLIVIGLGGFLFFGRFRAGRSQRERDDKIRWRKR